jgi:hypothetical protein
VLYWLTCKVTKLHQDLFDLKSLPSVIFLMFLGLLYISGTGYVALFLGGRILIYGTLLLGL